MLRRRAAGAKYNGIAQMRQHLNFRAQDIDQLLMIKVGFPTCASAPWREFDTVAADVGLPPPAHIFSCDVMLYQDYLKGSYAPCDRSTLEPRVGMLHDLIRLCVMSRPHPSLPCSEPTIVRSSAGNRSKKSSIKDG